MAVKTAVAEHLNAMKAASKALADLERFAGEAKTAIEYGDHAAIADRLARMESLMAWLRKALLDDK